MAAKLRKKTEKVLLFSEKAVPLHRFLQKQHLFNYF